MKRRLLVFAVFVCFTLRPAPGKAQGLPMLRNHDGRVSADAASPLVTAYSFPSETWPDSSNLRLIAPTSGAGLVINATMDTSITLDVNSVAIQNAINGAISILQSRFKDPITVSVYFRYATTSADGVTPLSLGTLAQSSTIVYTGITWASYISALQSDAKTANDGIANAHLPVSALSTHVLISPPNGRAVGMNTPGVLDSTGGFTGSFDGIVTLNSSQPFAFTRPATGGNYDAQRAIEHELDEVLGLGSYLPGTGDIRPEDIFSYSAPGTRNLLSTGTRYLSIDGGTTNLVGLNQDPGGDFGDWLSGSCPQTTPFVQNAFGCAAQSSDVTMTSPEAVALDAIGYDLVSGATGDFNGDGMPDIVLRNYSTGQNALWIMNGTSLSSIVDLPALTNTAWHIEGTGDFNGDGKTDILLRNYTTGQDALWLMNGTSLSTIVDLPALTNTAYHFAGVGDFDGDGKPDILLRNFSTGQNAVWLMNGTALSSVVDLPALPNTSYHIESCGDFNGDGKTDIVLRNYSTGQDALWIMNGTSLTSIVDLPALPNTAYHFNGVSDFNGDGKPDIVLRNYTTGQDALWVMNGTSLSTIVDLPALTNTSYEFDGPR